MCQADNFECILFYIIITWLYRSFGVDLFFSSNKLQLEILNNDLLKTTILQIPVKEKEIARAI